MDLADAVANFHRATRECDNLITIHRGYGGTSAGRREEETSINRAVVVLAVAGWQAIAQDLVLACIDVGRPAAGSPLSHSSYNLLSGRLKKEVGDFSTPNAENTRKLLTATGFDPYPCWTWQQHAGKGKGLVTWTPSRASDRLNEWLKVRHAIAHGHASLPIVDALQAVRDVSNPPVSPRLRLVDAEQCLKFLRRLSKLTTDGLADYFRVPQPLWGLR